MARHERRTFGEILVAGGDYVQGVRVLMRDANEKVLMGTCTTVPDAVAGFAKGCLLIKTDATGAGLYENVGTASSCSFKLITVAT